MNIFTVFIVLVTMVILVSVGQSAGVHAAGKPEQGKTALLIIDVQDFYFPGGDYALVNPEAAALNAAKLLKKFRGEKKLVIHVRHNAKSGAGIHETVTPLEGEKVISKDHANSFRDTDLLEYLKGNNVTRLVICGMMTHMCVEAAARAASDLGFKCTVVHDACATRALTFGDKTVSAEDVHYSTLSTLTSYAEVVDTEAVLKGK